MEGDVCNTGTFKAASAGVQMPLHALRLIRLTFSTPKYGSAISFTRGKSFIVLRERTGSVYLEEERFQSHGISLRNLQERQWGRKLTLPRKCCRGQFMGERVHLDCQAAVGVCEV